MTERKAITDDDLASMLRSHHKMLDANDAIHRLHALGDLLAMIDDPEKGPYREIGEMIQREASEAMNSVNAPSPAWQKVQEYLYPDGMLSDDEIERQEEERRNAERSA